MVNSANAGKVGVWREMLEKLEELYHKPLERGAGNSHAMLAVEEVASSLIGREIRNEYNKDKDCFEMVIKANDNDNILERSNVSWRTFCDVYEIYGDVTVESTNNVRKASLADVLIDSGFISKCEADGTIKNFIGDKARLNKIESEYRSLYLQTRDSLYFDPVEFANQIKDELYAVQSMKNLTHRQFSRDVDNMYEFVINDNDKEILDDLMYYEQAFNKCLVENGYYPLTVNKTMELVSGDVQDLQMETFVEENKTKITVLSRDSLGENGFLEKLQLSGMFIYSPENFAGLDEKFQPHNAILGRGSELSQKILELFTEYNSMTKGIEAVPPLPALGVECPYVREVPVTGKPFQFGGYDFYVVDSNSAVSFDMMKDIQKSISSPETVSEILCGIGEAYKNLDLDSYYSNDGYNEAYSLQQCGDIKQKLNEFYNKACEQKKEMEIDHEEDERDDI